MTTEKVEIDLEEECCGICRFCQGAGNRFGECHRRAPANDDPWVCLSLDDWCGEFEKEVI